MQLHILGLFRGYPPSFQAARALSPPPAQNLLQKAPPFRDTVFPVSLSQTLSVLPPTKKIEGSARDDDTKRTRFPHTLSLHDARDIHPHAVISSAVEKSSLHSVLPCPFRGRLPILLCHTYDAIPVCKKDRGLRSG